MSCYSTKKKPKLNTKLQLSTLYAENFLKSRQSTSKSLQPEKKYFVKKLYMYRPCKCDHHLGYRDKSKGDMLPHEIRLARLIKSIYSKDRTFNSFTGKTSS